MVNYLIFLSYRRSDSIDTTRRLYEVLEQHFGQGSVFVDEEGVLLQGEDLLWQIKDSLRKCNALLAVIGDHWLNERLADGTRRLDDPNDYVRMEIEIALALGIPVIPVLVGMATMPRKAELPESIVGLADRTPLLLRARSFRIHLRRLLQNLESQVAPDGAVPVGQWESSDVNYQNSLACIEEHLSRSEYAACVKACGNTVELGLKTIVQRLLCRANVVTRKEIQQVEGAIAGSTEREFAQFDLEELLRLFEGAGLWEELRRRVESALVKLRRIPWTTLVELRDEAVGNTGYNNTEEHEAQLMTQWAKVFLYECELIQPERNDPSSHADDKERCPACNAEIESPLWRFCPRCGWGVNLVCVDCRRTVEHDWRICPYCDAALSRRQQEVCADREYDAICRVLWSNRVLNATEREYLETKRLKLGLSSKEARQIEERYADRMLLDYERAVEALWIDGKLTREESRFLDELRNKLDIDEPTARQIEVQQGLIRAT